MFDLATLASILGGVGLFLLGIWLMMEGLKLAAGNALRTVLQKWTSTNLRGLLSGILITAAVRSSSAVTVATVGFVNAGLISLSQAVWVIFGTNVGTTTTGWLVVFVGMKFQIEALALPLIGIGMLIRITAGEHTGRLGAGQALAGFGIFFLAINVLQTGFSGVADHIPAGIFDAPGILAYLVFLLAGILLTTITQSSAAAMAIVLTATAGGVIPLPLTAATIIGTNIGTTSTAFFAALNATAPARRVAAAHIAFNLVTGVAALVLLPFLITASLWLGRVLGLDDDTPTTLAVFHTLFNCLGVALMWPAANRLVAYLSGLFISPAEMLGRPQYLDATLAIVPALALQGLVREIERMSGATFKLTTSRARQSPPLSLREDTAMQDSILTLGQAIREFMTEMHSRPLPDDVTDALPDLLRAIQHLEDLVLLSRELRHRPVRPGHDAVAAMLDEAAHLMEEVFDAEPEQDSPFPETLNVLASRAEDRYQATKSELLQMAATGRLHVSLMEGMLRYAQSIRRCTDGAIKFHRRFMRWRVRDVPDPEYYGMDNATI